MQQQLGSPRKIVLFAGVHSRSLFIFVHRADGIAIFFLGVTQLSVGVRIAGAGGFRRCQSGLQSCCLFRQVFTRSRIRSRSVQSRGTPVGHSRNSKVRLIGKFQIRSVGIFFVAGSSGTAGQAVEHNTHVPLFAGAQV